jgi:gluconate 2-dehydrogenase gamma chain
LNHGDGHNSVESAGPHADLVLSRRGLFRAGSIVAGAGVVSACSPATERQLPTELDVRAPAREPLPPDQIPRLGVYEFFTADEARTVAAIVNRIFPADDLGPSAEELGVVNYIDGKLAGFEAFAEPTYNQPPYAESYTGSPPADAPDDVVPVAEDQLYRYGYQSGSPPQDTYRNGLPALDDYARQRFDSPYTDLSEDQQDQILVVLEEVGKRSEGERSEDGPGAQIPGSELDRAEKVFGDVAPGGFFDMLRGDTVEGMFADPAYGGNRGLAGWTLIGYPGPQREYSPTEMKIGTRRRAQSLDGLPPMNPGRPHEHGIDPMQKPQRGVTGG